MGRRDVQLGDLLIVAVYRVLSTVARGNCQQGSRKMASRDDVELLRMHTLAANEYYP